MDLLLDTCDFLWLAGEPERLGSPRRSQICDPANRLFLSSVSAQEIAIKTGLGKLVLPSSPEHFVPEACRRLTIVPLPLVAGAALLLAALPAHHRDPFDRTLICQALFHKFTFASSDPLIRQYSVPLL